MTIMTTQEQVNNLDRLQERKAELRARLEAERAELLARYQTLRTDLEPGKLAASVAKSFLGEGKENEQNAFSSLQGPLKVAADLFIREPRVRFLVKYVAPFLMAYLPKVVSKAKELTPEKAEIYGFFRKGVTNLREQLRRKKKEEPAEVEQVAPINLT